MLPNAPLTPPTNVPPFTVVLPPKLVAAPNVNVPTLSFTSDPFAPVIVPSVLPADTVNAVVPRFNVPPLSVLTLEVAPFRFNTPPVTVSSVATPPTVVAPPLTVVILAAFVTPTTPPERAEAIAKKSTGFIYCVSVAGVTGARTDLPPGLVDRVKWLKTKTDVPILVGFGISGPEQVRAVAAVADGVIVGSALVRRIAEAAGASREQMLADVAAYTGDLAAACG